VAQQLTTWRRWVRQPQDIWLRKALFQIHLWVGLAIGLYIVMLSVTGSALVYRRELTTKFAARSWVVIASGHRLTEAELTEAARRVYPQHTVTRVGTPRNRNIAVEIAMKRGDDRIERYFDPYTGADLGNVLPAGMEFVIWLADLHDNLLFGHPGRVANGIGSVLVTLLCLTGAVIWWPGARNWRRSTSVKWRASWTRVNWDLHSAVGFWCFAFVLLWALSGIYLAFPVVVEGLADRIQPLNDHNYPRPSDVFTSWLVYLHFGRFRTQPFFQALWAVLGLVPAVMFVTGGIMWWNRVLKKRSLDLRSQDLNIGRSKDLRPENLGLPIPVQFLESVDS
jgi:uncharacterized iron-regulated membrane protein